MWQDRSVCKKAHHADGWTSLSAHSYSQSLLLMAVQIFRCHFLYSFADLADLSDLSWLRERDDLLAKLEDLKHCNNEARRFSAFRGFTSRLPLMRVTVLIAPLTARWSPRPTE